MYKSANNFLGLPPEFSNPENAGTVILPVPYEGGVSWGTGTLNGPKAIIKASHYVEWYDEVYRVEAQDTGVATLPAVDTSGEPEEVLDNVRDAAAQWVGRGKFLVTLGGDHSVTGGAFRGVQRVHQELACIQIDAHADLRDSYDGSRFSHSCVMSRIRELTPDTFQLGIRSMSAEEARRVQEEHIRLVTMHDYRRGIDLAAHIAPLPEKAYLTIDVDSLAWSVIRSTGTPEPGGFMWHELMEVLDTIFHCKEVVACDVVEMAADPNDVNSAFAAAKLVFKLIIMKRGIEHYSRMDGLV